MEIETELTNNNIIYSDTYPKTTITNSTETTSNGLQDSFYSPYQSIVVQDVNFEYNDNMYTKRRKREKEDEEEEEDEDEAPYKFYKHTHKQPETRDLPSCRVVKVQFRDKLIAEGKVLLRESWGIQVMITEENPDLKEVPKGSKWWTKWTGRCSPVYSVPIVEAVHSVQT